MVLSLSIYAQLHTLFLFSYRPYHCKNRQRLPGDSVIVTDTDKDWWAVEGALLCSVQVVAISPLAVYDSRISA